MNKSSHQFTIDDINRASKEVELKDLLGINLPVYETSKTSSKVEKIDPEVSSFLSKNGYQIKEFLGQSLSQVYSASSKKYGEVCIIIREAKRGVDISSFDVQKQLVGIKTGVTANLFYYDVIKTTKNIIYEIWVEEKAICTVEDYCRKSSHLNCKEKVNFIRAIHQWSIDADEILNSEYKLNHNDPSAANIAIFQDEDKIILKYIDLESLELIDDPLNYISYHFSAFDMSKLMDIMFP